MAFPTRRRRGGSSACAVPWLALLLVARASPGVALSVGRSLVQQRQEITPPFSATGVTVSSSPGSASTSDGDDTHGSDLEAVFVVHRHSRGPQNWHLLWSQLEFRVTPQPQKQGGQDCVLEVLTDDLVPRRGKLVKGGGQVLTLSPFGRDADVVLRCQPPPASRLAALVRAVTGAPHTGVTSPASGVNLQRRTRGNHGARAERAVTFNVAVNVVPWWTHAAAFATGLLLLTTANVVASSVASFYIGGIAFAATALALVLLVAFARAVPGGRAARRVMTPVAAVAALAPGLAAVREHVVSVYLRTSLWPIHSVARAVLHPDADTQPYTLVAATLVLLISAASGFFLVRSFLLDTRVGAPTRVLPGPSLFVLFMLRVLAMGLLLQCTSDTLCSMLVATTALAVAMGVPAALRVAVQAMRDVILAVATPFSRVARLCVKTAKAVRRQLKRLHHARAAVAANAAAQQAVAELEPPVPFTAPPPVYPASSTSGSGADGDGGAMEGAARWRPGAARGKSASQAQKQMQRVAEVGHDGGGALGWAMGSRRLSEHPCDPEPEQPPQPAPPHLAGMLERRRRESGASRAADGSSAVTAAALGDLYSSPALATWLRSNAARIRVLDVDGTGPEEVSGGGDDTDTVGTVDEEEVDRNARGVATPGGTIRHRAPRSMHNS
jgi:hypothetical protein